ncbi:MAG: ABC transporter ATP-binding protein/permease [Lactobacillus iners]|uniref:ATP-binding cassette domain-containing protein n=1 Tax=Lactobacillus iners TaxID=147802 RepID=UPI001F094631|nr:ABC transporter ATP-binding protein [Lactobacillus iners]MCT7756586.1 ABC transporter ATP-binding protein/permease [Lactobacillus iners]MCT7781731.1 ABC transporter ATP-binding protein/permease [Lactobacillus iners]MCT7800416.1 ABC transporter ATP-binding protein/permease [Lactobacillus iners]MCT7809367.1 ABC transporter ATP-binding protein/permease [Lactobacillus iners]MCT7810677.1 ABC transporter ATP-binding protein/permease [Lactobacillus iners]
MSFKDLYAVNRIRMISLLVLEFLTSGLIIGVSYINTYQITAIKNRKWQQFIFLITLSLILFIISYASLNICQYWIEKQIQQYNHKIRFKIVNHYFYDNKAHNAAEVQNRLTNDLNLIKDSKLAVYTDIPYYLAQIIFASIGLLLFHWSLLIVVLILGTLSFYLPKFLHPAMQAAALKLSQANKQYLDTAEKWLDGLSVLQRFSVGAQLSRIMDNASDTLESANIARASTMQGLAVLNKATSALLQFALLAVTAVLVTNHTVVFGVIVTVESFSSYINMSVKMLATELGQIHSVDSLSNEVNADTAVVEHIGNLQSPASLTTKNVSVKFSNGKIIEFPNLNIKSGEKVLLTGDSGTGKTTLFKVLLGKIKLHTGTINFKNKYGTDIKINKVKIRYIPQDPILFPDSIENNITMFNSKLKKKVLDYVKDVSFESDIRKMPLGLKTKLNLQKLNISGGQRQKIVLARACIHDDDFILIDEGTSAIDKKATLDILKKLLNSPYTVIFIAHNFNDEMYSLFDREIHLV